MVPEGLRPALTERGARLEAALRVGQLPRQGVAERRADRGARGRLRAVRAAHHRARPAGRQPAGDPRGQPPHARGLPARLRAPERPPGRRLVELRRAVARGLPPRLRGGRRGRGPRAHGAVRLRAARVAALPGPARQPERHARRVSGSGRRWTRPRRLGDDASPSPRVAPASSPTRSSIREPRVWLPGAAELYPVRVEAMRGGRSLAGYRLHVGIREIRVTDDGLLLVNGRRTRLFGANIHEERPSRGAALSPRNRRKDMQLYSELGATLIRSHYPLHPQYLETRGPQGVMVWDQVPVFAQGYKGFELPGVTDKALALIRAMVERDQNHPSVLAWSIANELNRAHDRRPGGLHPPRGAAARPARPDPPAQRSTSSAGRSTRRPTSTTSSTRSGSTATSAGTRARTARPPTGAGSGRFLDQMREYYPELGALRHRVRRRVQPQRARRPEGHVRVPARSPRATTSRRTSRSPT